MDQRQSEIQAMIDTARRDGFQVSMITLTAPHGHYLSADTFLGSTRYRTGISGAVALLKQRSLWREHIENYVSAAEWTYGRQNGYHYHFHLLVAHSEPLDVGAWFDAWSDCCADAGLSRPSPRHGVTVQNATNAAAYMAKWSVVSEAVGGNHKRAKNGNLSRAELESAAIEGHGWACRALKTINRLTYRRRTHSFSRAWSKLRARYARRIVNHGNLAEQSQEFGDFVQLAAEAGISQVYKSGLVLRPQRTQAQRAAKYLWARSSSKIQTASGLRRDYEAQQFIRLVRRDPVPTDKPVRPGPPPEQFTRALAWLGITE